MEAESEGPGMGSEFRVTLPLLRYPMLDPQGDEGGRSAVARRRIVLVEDQDDAREMLRELLEARGHTVMEASRGRDGVETIARVHPDVALVDIGLPEFDGYQVARTIRENPVLNDVVLVALTGYGTDEDRAAAREAGFSVHLTKPAELSAIERILRDVRDS